MIIEQCNQHSTEKNYFAMFLHTRLSSTHCCVGVIIAIFSLMSLCTVSNGQTCTQVGDCACQFSDGTKIDISYLGHKCGGPRFGYEKPSDLSYWEYAFNPCYKFSDDSCTDVVSCQRAADDPTISFPLGAADSASWSPDGGTVTYQSVGPDGSTRTSVLTLVCDPTGNPENPTLVRPTAEILGEFTYQLTSICACADGCPSGGSGCGDSGLSVGSILCIIFVVLVLVYLVGGIVFMKAVKGAEGKEVIPNVNFWMDFHNYVKDGFLFLFHGCKSPEYDTKI